MPNTNNINVELVIKNGVKHLNVVDHGKQNEVKRDPDPTKISWNLVGDLTKGNFVPMSAAEPGFSWEEIPKPVFGPATVTQNGNSIEIEDRHLLGGDSDGEWIYKLRVEYEGEIVTTTSSTGVGPGGTIDNPVIINR